MKTSNTKQRLTTIGNEAYQIVTAYTTNWKENSNKMHLKFKCSFINSLLVRSKRQNQMGTILCCVPLKQHQYKREKNTNQNKMGHWRNGEMYRKKEEAKKECDTKAEIADWLFQISLLLVYIFFFMNFV